MAKKTKEKRKLRAEGKVLVVNDTTDMTIARAKEMRHKLFTIHELDKEFKEYRIFDSVTELFDEMHLGFDVKEKRCILIRLEE